REVEDRDLVPVWIHLQSSTLARRLHVLLERVEVADGRWVGDRRQERGRIQSKDVAGIPPGLLPCRRQPLAVVTEEREDGHPRAEREDLVALDEPDPLLAEGVPERRPPHGRRFTLLHAIRPRAPAMRPRSATFLAFERSFPRRRSDTSNLLAGRAGRERFVALPARVRSFAPPHERLRRPRGWFRAAASPGSTRPGPVGSVSWCGFAEQPRQGAGGGQP